MDLREAYRVLELEPGANEDAVRDARKLLAKVWHPDRHANDPELAKKAQDKLADINSAFEAIRAAKFPASLPSTKRVTGAAPKQRPPTGPITPKRPPTGPQPIDTKADPVPPPPRSSSPPAVPPEQPTPRDATRPPKEDRDLLPRRRVRGWVIVLLAAGLGVGAYFAIVKLGSQPATRTIDAGVTDTRADAAVIAVDKDPDAAAGESSDAASAPPVTQPAGTFGLGSTREQVRAAMGEPDDKHTVIEETWQYGHSQIDFDPETGRVVGWWVIDKKLRAQLVPRDPEIAAKARAAGRFFVGSDKDEVIALQGTPNQIDKVIHETWTYGNASTVTFDDDGSVRDWSELDVKLHVK